ncbi:Nitrogen permease regulator 2, partial [Coemansia nantahalensis]
IELDLKGLLQPIASTGFSIKLFPYYKAPRDIRPFDVPVKLVDFELAKSKSAQTVYQKNLPGDILWDLVLERVTTCIDNVNHVRRIARLAQMEEETVVLALKHLDYYGCIALVDIFKFSNIYEAQHQMRELLRDPNLQRECLEYVTGGGHSGSDVQLEELLRLYTTLQQRRTVAEWVVDNGVDVDRLDVRRFVVFGVIHGLLRRVHRYPILSEPRPRSEDESAEPDVGLEPRILGMLDGAHPLDEISVASGLDAVTLRGKFSLHGKVEYMYM